MEGLTPIFAFFSFWMGACIASFLNVVIWRVPRGESIVSPPSHCPRCNAPIRWYQNLPIVAWLALRGRCASCKAPISPRYVLVELLGGLLFLAAFLRFNPVWPVVWPPAVLTLLVTWIWLSLMIVGSFIDCDHQLLPDFVTVGGMVLGVVHALSRSLMDGGLSGVWNAMTFVPLYRSLAGLAFGFGLLWFVRWLGTKAFRREAMGMGDVFLMGAVGALYGPVAVLITLMLSSFIGSVAGVGLVLLAKVRLGRFTPIPYGPYICLACLACMFYGRQLADAYLRLLGF